VTFDLHLDLEHTLDAVVSGGYGNHAASVKSAKWARPAGPEISAGKKRAATGRAEKSSCLNRAEPGWAAAHEQVSIYCV